jgi:hypothetical protein
LGYRIKEDEMVGACSKHGRHENAYYIVNGTPGGKRSLGRPRRKWEENIRMDLREIGREGVDWIHLAQDRDQWWAVVNMVINIRVPQKVGSFLTRRVTVSLSRRTLLRGVS